MNVGACGEEGEGDKDSKLERMKVFCLPSLSWGGCCHLFVCLFLFFLVSGLFFFSKNNYTTMGALCHSLVFGP